MLQQYQIKTKAFSGGMEGCCIVILEGDTKGTRSIKKYTFPFFFFSTNNKLTIARLIARFQNAFRLFASMDSFRDRAIHLAKEL